MAAGIEALGELAAIAIGLYTYGGFDGKGHGREEIEKKRKGNLSFSYN